jgi:hypothetical protein
MIRSDTGGEFLGHGEVPAKAAPRSRRSMAEGLTCVTPTLLDGTRGAPSLAEIRECLTRWSFNMTARADDPPGRYAEVHAWLGRVC